MKKRETKKSSDSENRLRQADKMARVLKILYLIQGRGRWNARSLAEEFEVSKKTIQRDVTALKHAGIPCDHDPATNSYRIRSDYWFRVPELTDEGIIGQAVATAITQSENLAVAGNANETTQKIADTVADDAHQLLSDAENIVSILGLQLADHTGHREIIKTIQEALILNKKIQGKYQSPYEQTPA